MAVDTGTVQVVMPAMGDSVSEGTVLEWHKQEGETVAADETIVEISTDKVDAEVPSPVAATGVKRQGAEGDTVAVGALLAEVATDGGSAPNGTLAPDTAKVEGGPVSGESPPVSAQEAVAGAANEADQLAHTEEAAGQTIDIVTPTGGESVTEGTVLEWSVKVGDAVREGDTVVEISTDKVDMELPAPVAGTIVEILAQEGETVTVGQVIGRMSSDAPVPAPADGSGQPAPAESATPAAPTAPAASTVASANGGHASPVARRVAAAEGIDLNGVTGTARGG